MENNKTTGIYIQATESQKQQIKAIAKACGLKQGDYILKTALGYRPKAVLPDAFFIYYDSLVKFLNSDLTPDVQKKALTLFDKIYHEFLDVKKLSKAEIVKQISGSPQSLLCGEKEQPLTGKPFDECRKKMKEIVNRYETGTIYSSEDLTIYAYGNQLIEKKVKLNKIQSQTAHREFGTLNMLSPIYGTRLQDATPMLLQNFLIDYCTNYTNSVIDKIYMLLNRIFNNAVDDKLIPETPMKRVEKPRSVKREVKVRALTLEEQTEFIRLLQTEDIQFADEMLISLFTGMRMGEVVALTIGDIDLENGYINIHRTMATDEGGNPYINDRTKTDTGMRVIKVTDEVKQLLNDICKGRSKHEFVFTRPDGRFISRPMIYSQFRRMDDKYHFIKPQVNTKVDLHSLRHTFATRCIESGMQAKVLQHILGHKDITTTYNTYGDVFDKFEFDNITKAENYLKENGLSIYGNTKPKIIKMA